MKTLVTASDPSISYAIRGNPPYVTSYVFKYREFKTSFIPIVANGIILLTNMLNLKRFEVI